MTKKIKELEKMSCRAYGGNNCVLHGCMFECRRIAKINQLKGKKKEAAPDGGVIRLQINWGPKKERPILPNDCGFDNKPSL